MILHRTASLSESPTSLGTGLDKSAAQIRPTSHVATMKRAENTAAYKALLELMGSGKLVQKRPKSALISPPERVQLPLKDKSLELRTVFFASGQKLARKSSDPTKAISKFYLSQATASPASTSQEDVASAEFYLASLQARLENGDTKTARRIAVAGATRYPQHAALQAAYKLLMPARVTLSQKVGVESFEILNHIRQESPELKGSWVAVSEGRLIASSSTLKGLRHVLSDQQLPRPPLVYKID